jgi:error-prone DNA polymerase
MRYGTSTPAALVERAAQHGQPVLGLTDRDGLYGAVRFVQAATAAGIAPVLGVDLAVEPDQQPPGLPGADGTGADGTGADGTGANRRSDATAYGGEQVKQRTPVRGGAVRDPRHPRVTVLARGRGAGVPAGVGWASLCRLVTDTHLRGERGRPVTTPGLVAARCGAVAAGDDPSPLVVLLGPDSDVGRALLARRPDRARALLAAWQRLLPADALAIEVV